MRDYENMDDGEKITLKTCRLDEFWKLGARDKQILVAAALDQMRG